MSIKGIIFDIDGTLIDTNPAHVEAWWRAFRHSGFEVPRNRIVIEIGKGGDKLVPSVLGGQIEEAKGDALRKRQNEEFLAIAKRERFRVFPRAKEILQELRQRRISTALATSSNAKHLEATLASAGVDFRRLVDGVVCRSPEDESKPSPDLVEAAVEELGLPASESAMVGDTVYDGQACRAAGVVFLGVLTGPASEAELLQAGARGVWRDVRHLLRDLDRALDLASPATAPSA